MTTATHRKLAQNYLQTVVILDDRLVASSRRTSSDVGVLDEPLPEDYEDADDYRQESVDDAPAGVVEEEQSPAASGPPASGPVAVVTEEGGSDPISGEDDEEDEHGGVDGLALVDEFAQIGLVCSLISPPEGEDFAERAAAAVRRLAQRADAFIFDWRLYGDAGGLVRELIAELLKPSDPRMARVRMIVVYTSQPGRADIRDLIAEHLTAADVVTIAHGNPMAGSDGAAYLEGDGFRVSVVGKPRSITGATTPAGHIVEAAQLPRWLVDEFAHVSSGLLQGVALEALSALRDNANHLLARLGPHVDPAFVSHAYLTGTGQEFAVQLVNQELETLVVGAIQAQTADSASLADWVRGRIEADGFTPQLAAGTAHLEVEGDTDFWLDHLSNRMEKFVKKPLPVKDGDPTKVSGFATVTSLFVDPQTAEHADMFMGAMSSLGRTLLDPLYSTPSLHLGTVLRDDNDEYWLCLQPLCDSVRVPPEGRPFPLSPLRKVSSSEEFELVIPIPPGAPGPGDPTELRWSKFKRKTQPYWTTMPAFAGDANGVVRPSGDSPDQWRLTSMDGADYAWIAELRPGHGQRIANFNAGQISRVGLDESEWLRKCGLNPQYKKQ